MKVMKVSQIANPQIRENIARGKGQAEAQKRCGYGSITLRREGEFAIVEVEFDGEQVEVIRRHLDSNFCHTIEPLGILEVLQGGEVTLA